MEVCFVCRSTKSPLLLITNEMVFISLGFHLSFECRPNSFQVSALALLLRRHIPETEANGKSVCQKCFNLIYEYDELQQKLTAIENQLISWNDVEEEEQVVENDVIQTDEFEDIQLIEEELEMNSEMYVSEDADFIEVVSEGKLFKIWRQIFKLLIALGKNQDYEDDHHQFEDQLIEDEPISSPQQPQESAVLIENSVNI